MIEGPILLVENETQMTPLYRFNVETSSSGLTAPLGPTVTSAPPPPTADLLLLDERHNSNDVVVVVSHLPSHPSLNSLSGSSATGGHSSASSVDGGRTVSTIGTTSTTTTSSSKRLTSADAAAVQQKVQDAWRARREERDQHRGIAKAQQHPPKPPAAAHNSAANKNNIHQQQLAKRGGGGAPALNLPMLCAMVQKGWKDAFDKPKPKAKKPDRPKVFPSVLSILEANALATQVRNLQEEYDDDTDDDDVDDDVSVLGDSTRGADSPRDQAPTITAGPTDPAVVASVLSILPAGYDWNKAILQMAQSRSRAFLLLDLAAIVRRTVLWKRTYPGVTWVHSVSANANPKLLQVLLMAGVRLATTTRTDLSHALDAQSKLKKNPATTATTTSSSSRPRTIVDSTARAAPPDSYIRELLNAKVYAITVDGADEVHRVVRTVQRMQVRHGGNSHGIKLELTLRLHPTNVAGWHDAARDALAALEEYPVHELTGMGLDVGMVDPDDSNSVQQRQAEAERVKDMILQAIPSVKIHLTGFEGIGGGDEFPQEWVEWWTRQRSDPRVREVSVECSFPLIASAGALCTRIIGVRANASERKQQLYIDTSKDRPTARFDAKETSLLFALTERTDIDLSTFVDQSLAANSFAQSHLVERPCHDLKHDDVRESHNAAASCRSPQHRIGDLVCCDNWFVVLALEARTSDFRAPQRGFRQKR